MVSASLALAAAVRASRQGRTARAVSAGLALLLAAFDLGFLALAISEGRLHWWEYLPLQLCDVAVLVAVYALLTRHPLAFELVYFWGATGSLIATVTPDLRAG